MTYVQVLFQQKGGVGKSTISVNLAAVTADVTSNGEGPEESNVAAVSIDPQGSAIWWANRVEKLPFHVVQVHDDWANLRKLKNLPRVDHVYVDTPGWMPIDPDGNVDPFGGGQLADALNTVLDVADHVIVPLEPEPLAFDPAARTAKILQKRNIPFTVVINNWDPRDGDADLKETKDFARALGWPLANTVIRHYKVHTKAPANGQVCTEYPANRVALQAREDFYKLALELKVGAK